MGWRRRAGTIFLAALWVLAPGAAVSAAEREHGAAGHQHGTAPMESLGERLFLGKAGPWDAEARLIDMKAQLEKSGVSAAAIAKLSAKHHLMVVLTDPKTKKAAEGVAGQVEITGPDKASSSKVPLVVMGGHIGSDVSLPKPGKYRFRVTAEGGGRKGDASFGYELKP
jgi:hypothetical protein